MGGGGFNTAPVPAASYIAAPAMLMDESQTEEGAVFADVHDFRNSLSFWRGNFYWMELHTPWLKIG